MRALQLSKKTLSRTLFFTASSSSFPYRTITTATSTSTTAPLSSPACHNHVRRRSDTWLSPSSSASFLRSPWSLTQHRGIRVSGSDVKVGNVIEKKGRIYQVVKTDHSHEGRGKATIKVELRDIESGNKVSQRLGTDESVERVFVQEKTYMYMCTDRNGTIVLMDVKTFDQLEVSQELFGKDAKYLQGEMRVIVRLYDDIPLSASVPKRVTCIVKEAQDPMKGVPAPPKLHGHAIFGVVLVLDMCRTPERVRLAGFRCSASVSFFFRFSDTAPSRPRRVRHARSEKKKKKKKKKISSSQEKPSEPTLPLTSARCHCPLSLAGARSASSIDVGGSTPSYVPSDLSLSRRPTLPLTSARCRCPPSLTGARSASSKMSTPPVPSDLSLSLGRDKKVVLENGLTVEVPMFVVAGDAVVINTETDSYVERAKA